MSVIERLASLGKVVVKINAFVAVGGIFHAGALASILPSTRREDGRERKEEREKREKDPPSLLARF